MLIYSSFDNYFQIAKCFRDEDLRKDRSFEFFQLDCEIKNTPSLEELQKFILEYIFFICNFFTPNILIKTEKIELNKIFENKIILEDLRFKNNLIFKKNKVFFKISTIDLKIPPNFTKFKYIIKDNFLIFEFRLNDFESKFIEFKEIISSFLSPKYCYYHFSILYHPPIFNKNFEFKGSPFNQQIINKDLLKSYELSFDIYLNGYEICTAALRENDPNKFYFFLKNYLKLSPKKISKYFGSILESLNYAPPNHGGFGLGMERFFSLILTKGMDCNIKKVIFFSKSKIGKDIFN